MMKTDKEVVYKEESYEIIAACLEVYNTLGNGFLESVYKEALEYEFIERNNPYKRETTFFIPYKNKILTQKFNADFVVYDKIILEVKAVNDIVDRFFRQTLNYLSAANFKLGILANFGEDRFKYKRIVN